jgi:hypothetical protein
MLASILLTITGLFVLVLGARKALPIKVCALCISVVLTWASLLVLYHAGHFHNVALLALLMGQSVTGFFYFVQKRVAPMLRVFTLPFFLTLTTLFYFAITPTRDILPTALILLGLWLMAYVIFSWRNDPGKKQVTDAAMNCCGEK